MLQVIRPKELVVQVPHCRGNTTLRRKRLSICCVNLVLQLDHMRSTNNEMVRHSQYLEQEQLLMKVLYAYGTAGISNYHTVFFIMASCHDIFQIVLLFKSIARI